MWLGEAKNMVLFTVSGGSDHLNQIFFYKLLNYYLNTHLFAK